MSKETKISNLEKANEAIRLKIQKLAYQIAENEAIIQKLEFMEEKPPKVHTDEEKAKQSAKDKAAYEAKLNSKSLPDLKEAIFRTGRQI